MRLLKLAVSAMVLTAPLAAQQTDPPDPPQGWMTRLDRPERASALEFVDMPPGMHITTNQAAGVFYHPDSVASGEYKVSSTIFMFDPGRRHREAYGIFIGGRDLQGEGQAYTYFLIRDSGEYLIKRRAGASTSNVVGWTASDAIMRYPGGSEQAKNTLSVVSGAETVDFYINETKVTSVPRSDLDTDGVVGVRVNHGLNVHVTGVTVERM